MGERGKFCVRLRSCSGKGEKGHEQRRIRNGESVGLQGRGAPRRRAELEWGGAAAGRRPEASKAKASLQEAGGQAERQGVAQGRVACPHPSRSSSDWTAFLRQGLTIMEWAWGSAEWVWKSPPYM